MQNCLQKTKSKSRGRKAGVSFVVILLSVCVVAAVILRHHPYPRSQSALPVYSACRFASPSAVACSEPPDETDKEGKMNNFSKENAKIESDSLSDGGRTGWSLDSVGVLFEDGVVREMALEEYVLGCVFGEMPLSFDSQALMAQSIAVRTFVVRMSVCGKSKHKNADICTSPACCQCYRNPDTATLSEESRSKLIQAVNATRGIIMTYDKSPIEAVYHASSGERTLSSEEVWGGRVEYLKSVPSPEGETLTVSTHLGHRVGMSQHGANILAGDNMSCYEILRYYYSGIDFEFLV